MKEMRLIRIALIVAAVIIVSVTIGGDGCLWSGHHHDSGLIGSSGVNQAVSPTPANNAIDVSVDAVLSWASAPNMISYDVYLGTTTSPSYVANVLPKAYRSSYTPNSQLQYSTTYYWRVDGRTASVVYTGYVWTFRTATEMPQITGANPTDGAIDVATAPTLSWNSYSGAVSYDIYLGLATPPTYITTTALTSLVFSSLVPRINLSYNAAYFWQIAARNSANTVLTKSPVLTFRTVSALNKPGANNPANGNNTVSINAQLSWASDSAAARYDVYFGAFNPPTQVVTDMAKAIYRTSYTPSSELQYSTLYYWQVKAKNSFGNVSLGDVWSFTTRPALPGQAGNPNPTNGAANISLNPTLNWSAATNASSYNVYFGPQITQINLMTTTVLTFFGSSVLSYNTLYYWRIDARNISGITAGPVWSFSTVLPGAPIKAASPTPANNTIHCGVNTQLSWISGPDAASYNIYFGAGNPPALVGNVLKTVYRTVYNPGVLQSNTTYYWRIDARNSGGVTTGDLWQFLTQPPLPAQVSNPNPASGTQNSSLTPVLSWSTAGGADAYDVYFGTTLTDLSLLTNTTVTQVINLASQVPITYSTTYYWQVDSINYTGATAGPVWNFRTSGVPDKVVIIAPADGAVNILASQLFSWAPAAGADSYDVYLGTTTNGWAPLTTTALTSYRPVSLSYSTFYYWRVDARNAAGVTAGDILTFTSLSSPAPVSEPMFPQNNATFVSVNIVLTWTDSTGADTYDIYLQANSSGWVQIDTTSNNNYALATLNPGTNYNWRIDARNAAGATTGPVWSFTTMPLPLKANTPSPANSAADVPLTASLSWTSQYADYYEVYFGLTSTGWSPITQTGTIYTPALLISYKQYYWKINGVNGAGRTVGDVWSFTTVLPSNLNFVREPADSVAGLPITPTVQVKVTDELNNAVFNIGVSITTTDGSLMNGTLTRATDINGIASFNDLVITPVGSYQLLAYLGVHNTTSTLFNIVPNVAKTLIWNTLPAITQTAGAAWDVFRIELRDLYNNFCSNDNSTLVTLSVVTGTSDFALGRSITATNGYAIFNNATYNVAESITIKGTASGLANTVPSSFISIAPAGPNKLTWLIQPAITQTAGVVWAPFSLQTRDAYNNICTGDNSTLVTLTGTGTAGFVQGDSAPAVNGVVEFNAAIYDRAEQFNVIGQASGLTASLPSNKVRVLNAAAQQLVWDTQPAISQTAGLTWTAFTINVLDSFNNLCLDNNNAQVTLITTSGTAGLTGALTVTASAGVVTFTQVTYTKAEQIMVEGISSGLTATGAGAAITVTASAKTRLAFLVQPPVTVTAGTVFSPAMELLVQDRYGNTVTTATESITLFGNGTALTGTLTGNAVSGVASFANVIAGTVAVTNCTMTALAAGLTPVTSTAFDILPDTEAKLAFIGQPTATVGAGETFTPPLKVAIQDQYGNTAPSATDTITLTGIGTILSGVLTQTAVAGVAEFDNVIVSSSLITDCTISATAAGLTDAVSVSFTIIAGPAKTLEFIQQPTTTAAGSLITPAITVHVVDQFGNNVPNAAISITSTIPILGTVNRNSDTNGLASFNNLVINKSGTGYRLNAICSGCNPVSSDLFDINAGAPVKLGFTVQPAASLVVGTEFSPPLEIVVQDTYDNTVLSATDAITITGNGTALSGTLVQSATGGIAVFSGVAVGTIPATACAISAMANGLSGANSTSFSVVPGAITGISFVQQPGNITAGQLFAPPVAVLVQDVYGNVIPGLAVLITSTNGVGVNGTLTQLSNNGGVAVFSDLTIVTAGTGYAFRVSAGLISLVSDNFDVLAGPAGILSFATGQPPVSTVAGQDFASAVRVTDAYGNIVSGASVDISTTSGTAIYGILTRTSDSGGIASFDPLSMTVASNSYVLKAATGAVSATSNTFVIAASTVTTLNFIQEPITNRAGYVLIPPVTVRARDVYGNNVPNENITMALQQAGVALGGTTLTATDAAGMATFNSLTISTMGNDYILSATALAGTIVATSSPFDIVQFYGPPLISTDEPTSVTYSSAVLNATVDPNGLSSSSNFEYGISSTPQTYPFTTTLQTFGGVSQTISAAISGLAPNTIYSFRVVATNTVNTSVGSTRSFGTWQESSFISGTFTSTIAINGKADVALQMTPNPSPWTLMATPPNNSIFAEGGCICRQGNFIYGIAGGAVNPNPFWRYAIADAFSDPIMSQTANTWVTLTSLPGSSSWGGAIVTTSSNDIYVAAGLTGNFYHYTISSNTWNAVTSLTSGTFQTGTTLVYPVSGGNLIYAVTGSNTFWAYSLSTNGWSSLATIPGIGVYLVYPGSGDYMYTVNYTTIYRYSISGDIWITMPGTYNPPIGTGGGSNGSWTYPGSGDYLYAVWGNYVMRCGGAKEGNTLTWSILSGTPDGISSGGTQIAVGNYLYGSMTEYSRNFWRFNLAFTTSWQVPTRPPVTVGEGGAMVYTNGDYIYALDGNGDTNFWRYSISMNQWSPMTNTPLATGGGAGLVWDGANYIYCTRGATYSSQATADFWRYSISSDSWTAMTSLPAAFQDSSALIYPAGSNFIYCIRGGSGSGLGTTNFYRYAIADALSDPIQSQNANTWISVANTPGQVGGFSYKCGGCAIAPTSTDIYAFQGNNNNAPPPTNAFWHYNIATNAWETKTPPALWSWVCIGASFAYPGAGDYIYAFQGGYAPSNGPGLSAAFARYKFRNTGADTWEYLANAPGTISSGGRLVATNNDYIYAFRGSTTSEFYRYSISQNSWLPVMPNWGAVTYGAVSVYPGSGDLIYATRGGATTDFYAYSVSANTWTAKQACPVAFSYCAALCSDGNNFIYAICGNNTTNFYRYAIADALSDPIQSQSANTWVMLAVTPLAIGSATYNSGSGLAYPGYGDFIYAVRGTGTNSFWKYQISTNQWITAGMPVVPGTMSAGAANALVSTGGNFIYTWHGGSTKIYRYAIADALNDSIVSQSANTWKTMLINYSVNNLAYTTGDGAGLTYPGQGDYIYFTSGGGTYHLERYSISGDSYSSMDALPNFYQPGNGGNMCSAGAYLYLRPGNSQTLFYSYKLGSYATAGSYTSMPIIPTSVSYWGILSFTATAPTNTTITVDILNAAGGATLATNVSSDTDLNTIPALNGITGIKLRTNLSTTNTTITPRLSDWGLGYIIN